MSATSRILSTAAVFGAGLAVLLAQTTPSAAFDRGKVQTFAVLPDGATGPEGLAVAANGDVYVTTFGFNGGGEVGGTGQLYVFNHGGRLLRQVAVSGSTSHLLGLGVQPSTNALLAIDFGASQVLKVNPHSGEAHTFIRLPASMRANAGLNSMTFDAAGNIYVSDSFQGIIWKTGPSGGRATAWVTDPSLTTTGSRHSAPMACVSTTQGTSSTSPTPATIRS